MPKRIARKETPTCTDTDWISAISTEWVWNESNSDCGARVEIYDVNLYYRVLDLDREEPGEDRQTADVLDKWMADTRSRKAVTGWILNLRPR